MSVSGVAKELAYAIKERLQKETEKTTSCETSAIRVAFESVAAQSSISDESTSISSETYGNAVFIDPEESPPKVVKAFEEFFSQPLQKKRPVPPNTSLFALEIPRLHHEIRTNNVSFDNVERMLEEGADPNAQDQDGNTALHIVGNSLAPWNEERSKLVSLLLSHGARVDIVNKLKETPLHALVRAKADVSTIEEVLRQDGSNVNAQDNHGNSILHVLAGKRKFGEDIFSYDTASLLLKEAANINCKNHEGDTPLHRAVIRHRSLRTIRYLLEAGADPTIKNSTGLSALQIAKNTHPRRMERHAEIVQLLAQKAALTPIPSTKVARSRAAPHPLKLHAAAQQIAPDFDHFITTLEQEIEQLNVQDDAGNTPLHYASQCGYYPAVKKLIATGADLTIRNSQGDSPLDCVVKKYLQLFLSRIDTPEQVKECDKLIFILCHEHHLYNVDRESRLLTLAVSTRECLQLTINTILSNIQASEREKIWEYSKIWKQQHTVPTWTTQDELGNTSLHAAILTDNLQKLDTLIKPTTVNIPNKAGYTPLDYAVLKLLENAFERISSRERLEQFNDLVAVLSTGKRFPLNPELATSPYEREKYVINRLLKGGADPFMQDKKGSTLIMRCMKWGDTHMTAKLKQELGEQ